MTHRSLSDASTSRRGLLAGSAVAASALVLPASAPQPGLAQDAPESYDATITRRENASQPIRNEAPAHQRLTEQTGVRLSFQPVPSSDWTVRRQTILSTDQVPDLLYVANLAEIREFLDEDVLLPLNQLIAENGPNIQKYLVSNPQFSALYVDDELYYVPGLYFNWRRLAPMPMIRMDIVQQLGLTPPTTLDELLPVIAAMKAATPGSVGWTNRNNTLQIIGIVAYPLGSGSGIYFDEQIEGGRWVYGPTRPEFRAVLEYLAGAYANGTLDTEFSITPADAWQTKNSSGQGLFTWDNMSFAANWNGALRGVTPDTAGWQPLPTLAGPLGARQRDYDFIREGWAIGANSGNPAALIRMMDWMLSPDGIDTTNWGIEGQHFTRNAPLPASIEDYSAAGLSALMASGRNTLLPGIQAQYATTGDPFRTFQSDTGTGLLDFALTIDDTITFLWSGSPELDSWFELTASDPGLRKPVAVPPLTVEEAQELQDLNRSAGEILEPAYDQVILGQISLDDYASIAESAVSGGTERIEEIYNDAQARLA